MGYTIKQSCPNHPNQVGIRSDDKYCWQCGTKLVEEKYITNCVCGNQALASDKYCTQCGKKIERIT